MFLITIGATNFAVDIMNNINEQLEVLKKSYYDITWERYEVNETIFIKCGIRDNIITRLVDKKQCEDFKFDFSKILADTIIEFWEPKLLKRILKENYFYLTEKEKESVSNIAYKLLQEEKPIIAGGFYKVTRRNKIIRYILDYLNIEEVLNIDGFINFRLGVYIKDLNETIERAIELYVTEREYNEFIKLLKYFVDIQECKIDVLHLRQSSDGKYVLLDEDLNSVNSEYFDEVKAEISEENINYDDLLISTLITISPKKIFLHDIDNFSNKELINTIKNVFGDRINICSGCELCKENYEIKNNIETNKFGL